MKLYKETQEFAILTNRVTDLSFLIVAVLGTPLNLIIFQALKYSEHQFVRIIPPIFAFLAILYSFLRKYFSVKQKIWMFISIFFTVGIYCLLLGLIDVAGLWFLMIVAFVILLVPKKQALIVLLATIGISTITGLLLMSDKFIIPFHYDFYNCQTYCILTRLLHYIIISIIVYFIISSITSHLKSTIIKLEQEMEDKKVLQKQVLETVIQTEEKERKRIASDLHDGLGPVFSTAKLYFQAYSDAKDEKSEKEIKEKLEKIFDTAISSISEISHIISPHELINHGLIPALGVFLNHIERSGKIKITFKHDPVGRLNSTIEMTLYRAINELVNNTLKHSGASELSLQLKIPDEEIEITYSDNGKGFDINEKQKTSMGMGLRNIESRIESINGIINYSSTPENGMTAYINVPFKQKEDE